MKHENDVNNMVGYLQVVRIYSFKTEIKVFLVFTKSQETQKTIDIAAMLVSKIKEIIKILLLRVHQHGSSDVRWKRSILLFTWIINNWYFEIALKQQNEKNNSLKFIFNIFCLFLFFVFFKILHFGERGSFDISNMHVVIHWHFSQSVVLIINNKVLQLRNHF